MRGEARQHMLAGFSFFLFSKDVKNDISKNFTDK